MNFSALNRTADALRIRRVRARPVEVPMKPPIETAAGTINTAPLVLIDLETEEGVTGRSYVFTYNKAALGPTALLVSNIGESAANEPLAPLTLSKNLSARFRLLGTQGLVGIALSGIDMAAWDAFARSLNLPLYRVLGADKADEVTAYASLRGAAASSIAEEAAEAHATGFKAAKVKFAPASSEDIILDAVRGAMGENAAIMVDYNQALTVPEAIERAARLENQKLAWIEEPVRADDFCGHAKIAASVQTPIQLGENYWGPDEVARSLKANASDLLMPDLMKIGGVTGWMQTAALANAASVPVSSHIFVEFSAHVLMATPGRHYLEWLDIAAPIVAEGTPACVEGKVKPAPGPGVGISWDEDAVKHFSI